MILLGCCGTTDTYESIATMGYDYVELSARQIMELSDEQFEEFLKIYNPEKLPCRGFNDYCSKDYPIVGPGCGSEACVEYARKLCKRGHALGIRTIGIGAPAARTVPEGYDKAQADADMVAFLKTSCKIAEEYNITLLLEAVHKYLCNYMTTTPEAFKMVEELKIPNLGIVLDYYHAMVMEEDLHDFGYVMPYVRHLHISTDLEDHKRGYLGEEDVPLLKQLLAEAAAAGYEGGISVEAGNANLAADGASCQQWMRKALPA